MYIDRRLRIIKIVGIVPLILLLATLIYSLIFCGITDIIKGTYDGEHIQEIYSNDRSTFRDGVEFINDNYIINVAHSKDYMLEDKKEVLRGTLYYELSEDIQDISENNTVDELFDKYDFDWITKNDDGSILFVYPNICLIYSTGKNSEYWTEIEENWYYTSEF